MWAPKRTTKSDPLFALASGYRALFTVVGGYATARLAPNRPMRHAWILASIGLVAGLAGVIDYSIIAGAELGPAWYAISIPIEAIPCVWLGARLALTHQSSERASGVNSLPVVLGANRAARIILQVMSDLDATERP